MLATKPIGPRHAHSPDSSPDAGDSPAQLGSRQIVADTMNRLHPPPVELDEGDEDEFKPLFDYSDTVPVAPELLSSDDSDDEGIVISALPPKRKFEIAPSKEPFTPMPTPTLHRDQARKAISDEDDDDDSWMTSPSKLPKLSLPAFATGSLVLQQLRSKRQELMMLQQQASPEALRRVEELARMRAQQRPEPGPPLVVKASKTLNSHEESGGSESPAASEEKEKILLKVQNNTQSTQSIRIFTTDHFSKLFKVYADLSKLPLEKLLFRFDGDEISPNDTPKELDMEEGYIIEVYIRS